MKLAFFSFLTLWTLIGVKGQKIRLQILKQTDSVYRPVNAASEFWMLDSAVGMGSLDFVATISAETKTSYSVFVSVLDLQYKIGDAAKKLGANSFWIKDYFLNDSSDVTRLTLDTYFSKPDMLKVNDTTRTTNTICIFQDYLSYNKKKTTKVRLNRKQVILGYREYLIYHLKTGERLTLGGIPWHDSQTFEGYPGNPSVFIIYNSVFTFLPSVTTFNVIPERHAEFLKQTYFNRPIVYSSP